MILLGLVGIQGIWGVLDPFYCSPIHVLNKNFQTVIWKNIEKSVTKIICILGDLIEQLGFQERYFWNWGTQIYQEMKKNECASFFKTFFPGQGCQIRRIRTGFHPKLYLASYYIQLSTNIKMYNNKIKTSFFSLCLWLLRAKNGFNLIFVHFISAESCL